MKFPEVSKLWFTLCLYCNSNSTIWSLVGFIYWNKCWTNWSITNPIWLSCITEIILPSKITNPSYDDGRIGVLTKQRRWTVNSISCINKVSDQWKMLVNIQGKGRALDEKSERLLMDYNMFLDPEGKIDRRLLLPVSLRISESLWVCCGIGLKHDGGHASGWGIFSSACPAPETVLILSLSHDVKKMCSSIAGAISDLARKVQNVINM